MSQRFLWWFMVVLGPVTLSSEPAFRLPTANRAIFEPKGAEHYFAPTPGRTWESGTFGCVRSEGGQFHEGIDIRALQRDRRGEPTDAILASADGWVVYTNRQTWKSNYGKYVVLGHKIEGLEVFTLYAHLSAIRDEVRPGRRVLAGATIARMGRTANTSQRIGKDRAHLHFEVAFLLNEYFSGWYAEWFRGDPNYHGIWHGRNLVGLDPARLFREQKRDGAAFHLRDFVRNQTALFRVWIPKTDFPWARRYAPLIRINPAARTEGIAGYEVVFDYSGFPFRLVPRTAREVEGRAGNTIVTVNEEEYRLRRCRKLIRKQNGVWVLTGRGRELVALLSFTPQGKK